MYLYIDEYFKNLEADEKITVLRTKLASLQKSYDKLPENTTSPNDDHDIQSLIQVNKFIIIAI